MSTPMGATGLLVGAISYALGACAPIGPGELGLPTPCADWDLAALLGHLGDSMADLETVEALRDRAAQLVCASYGYTGPERFVTVGGLPMPAGLVACTGAVEIAVHGWDVSAARARAGRDSASPDRGTSQIPIPAALATRML